MLKIFLLSSILGLTGCVHRSLSIDLMRSVYAEGFTDGESHMIKLIFGNLLKEKPREIPKTLLPLVP